MPILAHEAQGEELNEICAKYTWVIPPEDMRWDDEAELDKQFAYIFMKRGERIATIREMARTDRFALDKLKRYYRANKVQFIIDWGCTFDPRKVGEGHSPIIPFIPFPKQIAALEFFEWCLKNREYGLLEKSRECGASWLAIACAVSFWLFEPGFVAGFGSRKEEYIDKAGDPKSLFWRARKFLEYIPDFFMPSGFTSRKHSLHMRIINPENNAVLTGEAGDNIGRGDRTTIYFVDEAAFLERPMLVDAALSATTNCRIDVSTSNGAGTPFFSKIISGRHPVFRFSWREDPRKDEAWYRDMQRKLDPIILAQEVDIDHNASIADNFINGASVTAAMVQDSSKIKPEGATVLAIDAAHFGDDKSVVTLRQGRVCFWQKKYTHKSGPDLAGIVREQVSNHYDFVDRIVIELDGPGVSAYDQMKLYPEMADRVVGVHTGRRLSDGKNYNLRAKMYRKLRDWLDATPCVVPKDNDLMRQLASIPYEYRDGKLLLTSKKDVKKKGFKSPDEADSIALTFAVKVDHDEFDNTFQRSEMPDKYYNPPVEGAWGSAALKTGRK